MYKITIFLDTCSIQKSKKHEKDILLSKEIIYQILHIKKENYKKLDLEICIPEVVLLELYKHEFEDLNNKIEEYNSLTKYLENYNLLSTTRNELHLKNFKKNIIEKTNQFMIEKAIKNVNFKSVKLKDIVNRSIEHTPPFKQKHNNWDSEKNKDAGFKDTVIWESILAYKNNNEDRKIIFLSNDKVFKKLDLLAKEFSERFNEDIIIKKDFTDIENEINTILKINKDKQKDINKIKRIILNLIPEIILELNKKRAYLSRDFHARYYLLFIGLDIKNSEYSLVGVKYSNYRVNSIKKSYKNIYTIDLDLDLDLMIKEVEKQEKKSTNKSDNPYFSLDESYSLELSSYFVGLTHPIHVFDYIEDTINLKIKYNAKTKKYDILQINANKIIRFI